MAFFNFLWTDEIVEHIAEHGLDQDDEEPTLSGELRRAIHASDLDLAIIASHSGIAPIMLDEFLTGERTLRSDVLDRLAKVLGFKFQLTS